LRCDYDAPRLSIIGAGSTPTGTRSPPAARASSFGIVWSFKMAPLFSSQFRRVGRAVRRSDAVGRTYSSGELQRNTARLQRRRDASGNLFCGQMSQNRLGSWELKKTRVGRFTDRSDFRRVAHPTASMAWRGLAVVTAVFIAISAPLGREVSPKRRLRRAVELYRRSMSVQAFGATYH